MSHPDFYHEDHEDFLKILSSWSSWLKIRLFLQMERDTCDDRIGSKQKSALDEKRRLIMQKVMPPLRGNKFWQHNGDQIVVILLIDFLYVIEQRTQQRAVRRFENNEGNIDLIFLPIEPHILS